MNPYFLVGAAFAVAMAGSVGYYKGDKAGQAFVNQQWDRERAEQMAAFAEAQRQAREKEQALQAGADNLRQEKEREIRNITARANALANSLRDRPDRTAAEGGSVSGASGNRQSGCTGKELYREDGEFLVRVAREADELRASLKQCYSQYDSLRLIPK